MHVAYVKKLDLHNYYYDTSTEYPDNGAPNIPTIPSRPNDPANVRYGVTCHLSQTQVPRAPPKSAL